MSKLGPEEQVPIQTNGDAADYEDDDEELNAVFHEIFSRYDVDGTGEALWKDLFNIIEDMEACIAPQYKPLISRDAREEFGASFDELSETPFTKEELAGLFNRSAEREIFRAAKDSTPFRRPVPPRKSTAGSTPFRNISSGNFTSSSPLGSSSTLGSSNGSNESPLQLRHETLEARHELAELSRKLKRSQESHSRVVLEHETKIEDLEADIVAAEANEKKLRLRNTETERELAGLQKDFQKCLDELHAMREERDEWQRKCAHGRQQSEEAILEAERQRNILARRDEEIFGRDEHNRRLEADLEQMRQNLNDQEKLIDDLRAEMESAQAENEDERLHSESLSEDMTRLQAKLDDAKSNAQATLRHKGSIADSMGGENLHLEMAKAFSIDAEVQTEGVKPNAEHVEKLEEQIHLIDSLIASTRRNKGRLDSGRPSSSSKNPASNSHTSLPSLSIKPLMLPNTPQNFAMLVLYTAVCVLLGMIIMSQFNHGLHYKACRSVNTVEYEIRHWWEGKSRWIECLGFWLDGAIRDEYAVWPT